MEEKIASSINESGNTNYTDSDTRTGNFILHDEIYMNFIHFSPDAIFYFKNGTIIFTNDKGLGILKAKNYSEVLGKKIIDFVHPDSYGDVEKILNGLKDGHVPHELIEHTIICIDGSIAYIEISYNIIPANNETVVISIIRDITEKKIMQMQLEKSNDRYKRLLQSIPDTVIVSSNKKVSYINDAGLKLLGARKPEDVIGRDILSFTHPDYAIEIRSGMQGLFSGNYEVLFMEEKLKRMDGTFVNVETTTTLFPGDGENVALNIVHDITKRKQAEEDKRLLDEAVQFDKLKTEFFANLSHEFKTPLNIILGAIQLVSNMDSKANDFPCRMTRYINMMKQNSYRLIKLINNLLDITRLDAGFYSLNLGRGDIVKAVEDITLSVVEYTQNKNIELIFDTDIEEKMITFDMDKIERIILNLLSNAIKFTPSGGEIFVNMYDGEEKIIISIKDTGIGIPEDMLEKIFERFRQVDPLYTRSSEGSGIGLSLVKSLVELHGGEITVNSVYGSGSEFIVSLPTNLTLPDNTLLSKKHIKDERVERINVELSDIYL